MLKTEVKTYSMLIDGQWTGSSNGKTFDSINPADNSDVVGRFPAGTTEDAIRAIRAAEAAFESWSNTAPSKRAEILKKAATLLENRVEQYAEELTREEGKIISMARAEIKRSAATFRFYAEEGLSFGGETYPVDDANSVVYSIREPLGVVSVITPWNFPLSIPSRKIAPALITGNTVVFKPASETPLIALRLVEALVEAGLPSGVLNFITGSGSQLGDPLANDPAIKAITFTGSTETGMVIQNKVSLTTRTQMELGGKNPILVMEDGDIDLAVNLTIKGGFDLSGQACTGTSRVIVMRAKADEFVSKLIEKTKQLRIGNGLDETVEVGPLANEKQLKSVSEYVRIGQEEGAKLLSGGVRPEGEFFEKGYYLLPAVFTDVTPNMRIAQEEIFGPVISVLTVDSFEEAMRVANDVEYGLSASIITKDIATASRFAKGIQSGTVKVNRTTTGNLINAPFGGLKNSSTSTFRESGRVGLEFFTQIKMVYLGY